MVCFWHLHIKFRLKFKKKLMLLLINKHITIWLRNSQGPSSQNGIQIIELGFVQHLEECFNMSFIIFRKIKSNFAIEWLSLVPLLKGFGTSLILRIKFKSTKIKANRSNISWNEFIGTYFTRCSGNMFAKFHVFFLLDLFRSLLVTKKIKTTILTRCFTTGRPVLHKLAMCACAQCGNKRISYATVLCMTEILWNQLATNWLHEFFLWVSDSW